MLETYPTACLPELEITCRQYGWSGEQAAGFLKRMENDVLRFKPTIATTCYGMNDFRYVPYDEARGKAIAANGHEVLTAENGKITLRSTRLPFCPGPGATDKDDSIRPGLALVPFDDELNRFTFRIGSPKSASYTITWGEQSRTYTTKELETGVNLAKDSDNNPLVPAFKKIWDAVSKKQEYETCQIKALVHGPEGAADLDATFALTEKVRTPLANAILAAKQATEHPITVGRSEAVGYLQHRAG